MGLWRTFRWDSGRLGRSAQIDFWQISRTAQDPSIPNFPLETPTAGSRTIDLGVTLAGCVVAAAATLVATAALAVQLAGATVGSGVTVPTVADLGKTLAGATLSATATTAGPAAPAGPAGDSHGLVGG
jgi:hypothetical protein